jgi:hypothetical protein
MYFLDLQPDYSFETGLPFDSFWLIIGLYELKLVP